jgi:hypothetical protein
MYSPHPPRAKCSHRLGCELRWLGFVQLQMDKDGKLGLLRLSFDDGQAYEFRRE